MKDDICEQLAKADVDIRQEEDEQITSDKFDRLDDILDAIRNMEYYLDKCTLSGEYKNIKGVYNCMESIKITLEHLEN